MPSISEFKDSLKNDQPPEGLTDILQALWWDAKGNWEKAHEAAQDISNVDGAWVHAYLHRKEGDEGNASYWYSHARKPKSAHLDDVFLENFIVLYLNTSSKELNTFLPYWITDRPHFLTSN